MLFVGAIRRLFLLNRALPSSFTAARTAATGDCRRLAPGRARDAGIQSGRGPAGRTVCSRARRRQSGRVLHRRPGTGVVCESFRQGVGVTDNRKHDDAWLDDDLAAQTVADRLAYHKKHLQDQVGGYTEQDDRIRLLEDTDGDGRADSAKVFADHFNGIVEGTGAGVLVNGDDVFYTCIPHLWRLRDTDGDGRADQRQSLHEGYGVRVAFRGHDLHGLTIGPDGRLYFSVGDRGYNIQTESGRLVDPESGAVFRCNLDGSQLEVVHTGLRNPQELAFDDYGNLFTVDNNSDSGDRARLTCIVEGGETGWRMAYQYLPGPRPFQSRADLASVPRRTSGLHRAPRSPTSPTDLRASRIIRAPACQTTFAAVFAL